MKKCDTYSGKEIAITGMSATFPMAENLGQFWQNLVKGIHCIRNFPCQRRDDIEEYIYYRKNVMNDRALQQLPELKYYKAAFLDTISGFDYDFFHITPNQALLMDVNQRLLLAEIYHALEDAGYLNHHLEGSRTGVYLAFTQNPLSSYTRMIHDLVPGMFQAFFSGNLPAILPGRIAHMFDLRGPGMLIDTACSSGLVAVHEACTALKSGECDCAIVAGIKTIMEPIDDPLQRIGIESVSGEVKVFDAHSDGTLYGEGVGVLVLKPLDSARRDRDNIHGIIKGSAVNQDGNSASITSPNLLSQAEVLMEAWENGGINPESITYIETHGTGTRIGDPIEIKAIEKAFKRYTKKKNFCALSSTKPHCGHMLEASGIAGIIKALLILKNKKLPPLGNFSRLPPEISLEDSPVYINTQMKEWNRADEPLRCGVSAFGFSGTNCHIVIEQAPAKTKKKAPAPFRFFTLSAQTKSALHTHIHQFIHYLKEHPGVDEQDICFSLTLGRSHYEHRLAIVLDKDEVLYHKLLYCLENLDNNLTDHGIYASHSPVTKIRKEKSARQKKINTRGKQSTGTAQGIINELTASRKKQIHLLKKLARLYVAGAGPDFTPFYEGIECRKISLPLYPYEKKKCWLSVPDTIKESCHSLESTPFHKTIWKQTEAVTSGSVPEKGSILLIISHHPFCREMIRELKSLDYPLLIINQEDLFRCKEDHDRYGKLIDHPGGYKISHIIDMSSLQLYDDVKTIQELENHLEISLFHLLHVVHTMSDSIDRLTVVADYVHRVRGDEVLIKDFNGPLAGFMKIMPGEFPGLLCRLIDSDKHTPAGMIATEILSGEKETIVAYRKSCRFREYFIEVDCDSIEPAPITLKNEGVYLVTGGLGGIGREMIQYLLKKQRIHIAITGRSAMPSPSEWDSVAENTGDVIMKNKIDFMREMNCRGASLHYYSVDVADFREMKDLLDTRKKKHGRINGIIHSAGIPGENFIRNSSKKSFQKILRPKIAGTFILHELTKNDSLDFFILHSSIASLFGTIGQAEYAAANAYMDAFAEKQSMKKKKIVSINWVAWKETGMAVNAGLSRDTAFKALSTREALESLDIVFHRQLSRITIGKINYSGKESRILLEEGPRLSSSITRKIEKRSRKTGNGIIPAQKKSNKQESPSSHIHLEGRESGFYNHTEKIIAGIWAEVFGYNEIDVTENFFALGGDSIIAVNIIDKLSKKINIQIELMDIMNYLTICELAEYIDSRCEGPGSIPALTSISAASQPPSPIL